MKGLVVYNTCGLGGNENVRWYIDCLKSILNQRGNFDTVVSSCCNSTDVRSLIKRTFGDKVSINCIDGKVPVNITFNSTAQTFTKLNGPYDWYLYVDSGINFATNSEIVNEIERRFETGNYSMVTIQASNDNGFLPWLGIPGFVTGNDVEIPPGKACNAHVFAYTREFYENFNGKLWPDIFAAYCTESVFSFMNAALGKKWVIVKDHIVYHAKGAIGADGASAGFDHVGPKGHPWNNLLGGLDMNVILSNPEAWNSGFGYEEVNQVFLHNSSAYNEDGTLKDKGRLLKFLNENIFLPEAALKYEDIPNLVIK